MTRVRSVVILTHHFPPEVGGIQTRISKYIETLNKRGIRVTVLVAGRNPKLPVSFADASVASCPGGIKHLPRNAILVTRSAVATRADVVHVFTGASTLLGLYALVVARTIGAKSVVSFFGREDFDLSQLPRILLRLSTSLAEVIDVNSTATRSLLPEEARTKVHVLLGGAEESRAVPSEGTAATPVLLFVGRLIGRKGIDDLLRAFAIVKPSFPEARLTIVGDGPQRADLVRLTGELHLLDSVDFRGTLRGYELDKAYSQCTALILPSKDVATDTANEGLGLTLIEASMHGKPLIGTRHGGIPEVVKDGENGFLVPPGNPSSLADAIRNLLGNEGLARRMGERALQMARSRFTWERATDVLLESYA